MVSINTNLSSLIVQSNLNQATNGLNKAIERLSTGYKINHASDNAANYSIANSYESKLSSYEVAASNVQSGLDLLSVAQDTISTMQDHGSRLQALITQARNGTYGTQSLNAMTQEAGAIISEIQRMYTNTEYNGINLFDAFKMPDWTKEVKENAGKVAVIENGFIANIAEITPDVVVTSALGTAEEISLADAIAGNSIIGIDNASVLARLATLVNNGTDCSGKTFVLTNDIDLSAYQAGAGWTAIGTGSHKFNGTFDGQGHKITGLKINRSAENQGLFSYLEAAAIVKNVGLENVDIDTKGKKIVGALVGYAGIRSIISNCYATGKVSGGYETGGLVGFASTRSQITNCHVEADIKGTNADGKAGGIIGHVGNVVTVSKCIFSGSVYTVGGICGGIAGVAMDSSELTNCYSEGEINAEKTQVGGIIGKIVNASINKCYSTSTVNGKTTYTGGLAGFCQNSTVSNSYATGDVDGTYYVGGLIGKTDSDVTSSFATGNVFATSYAGGLIGQINKPTGSISLNKLFSSGSVSGEIKLGNLIGGIINTSDGSNFSTINITNATIASSSNDAIGGAFSSASGTPAVDYDMTSWLNNITIADTPETSIQVGIMGNESDRISFKTGFTYGLNDIIKDISSNKAYSAITKFMSTLSAKATDLGSVSNRLESSLESIAVNMQNLGDSLSTVKDVDMAEVSSEYIKKQILQQASATLLATANQSPAIALQLI